MCGVGIMSYIFHYNDNDNEYDLLSINFIQWVNNYLVFYYKKLKIVYAWETIIKAKTTLEKHIAPKIGGQPYSFSVNLQSIICKIFTSTVQKYEFGNIMLIWGARCLHHCSTRAAPDIWGHHRPVIASPQEICVHELYTIESSNMTWKWDQARVQ